MCIFSIKTISISIDKSIRGRLCKTLQIVGLHDFPRARFSIFDRISTWIFPRLDLTNDKQHQRFSRKSFSPRVRRFLLVHFRPFEKRSLCVANSFSISYTTVVPRRGGALTSPRTKIPLDFFRSFYYNYSIKHPRIS